MLTSEKSTRKWRHFPLDPDSIKTNTSHKHCCSLSDTTVSLNSLAEHGDDEAPVDDVLSSVNIA